VNTELEALLVVQQDDEVIRGIQARHDALAPRLAALDKVRLRAVDEVARNEASLRRELERNKVLEAQMAEHRLRHEKNLAVLDQAHKLKEATAAMAQVETARRVLAEEESEMLALTRRIADLRTATEASKETLAALEQQQADMRGVIGIEREEIARSLEEARARRAVSAQSVNPSLLSKYDRVHARRRDTAIYAVHSGFSCGSCDTAIPLQRRPAMTSGAQAIEVCEACGVLLYLPTPAVAS
jgi:predicted  nucleic acid-binding Zn-ribbon protein